MTSPTPSVESGSLLDFAESQERAEVERCLARAVRDPTDPFDWCARPQLFTLVSIDGVTTPAIDGAIDWTGKLRRDATELIRVGRIVFAADTDNQRRTLWPVVEACRELVGAAIARVSPRAERTELRALTSAATRWTTSTVEGAHEHGVELDPRRLHHLALVVARTIARARAVIQPGDIVVVANQHVPIHRAWLWVAHERDCATVYVPHAPVARNRSYVDLPVTMAVLRGPAEAAAYLGVGAVQSGLAVGGNPGIATSVAPVTPDPDAPVVLAPPLVDDDAIERMVGLVLGADVDHVLVAPHPAADHARLASRLPPAWAMLDRDRTTTDVLLSGAGAVVQRSSGLGWESLYLGTPVIEAAIDDRRPRYLYLDDGVPTVRSAGELRRELTRLPPPEACRALADRWCSGTGRSAAASIARAIDRAGASSTRRSVLDGWFGSPYPRRTA